MNSVGSQHLGARSANARADATNITTTAGQDTLLLATGGSPPQRVSMSQFDSALHKRHGQCWIVSDSRGFAGGVAL